VASTAIAEQPFEVVNGPDRTNKLVELASRKRLRARRSAVLNVSEPSLLAGSRQMAFA
jgi:hypothetical protein